MSRMRRRCVLEPDELPFHPRLTFRNSDAVEALVGLGPAADPSTRAMRTAVLANALDAEHQGIASVFYSRDRNFYAQRQPYWPTSFTLTYVVRAVAELVERGILSERRTAPSPRETRRSRFQLTTEARLQLRGIRAADFVFFSEPLVIRTPDGSLTRQDVVAFNAMRRDVQLQNAFLAGFEITIDPLYAGYDEEGYLCFDFRRVNPFRRTYTRIFNGSLRFGGRWFGCWWQAISQAARRHILIDGSTTIELDYRACHLRLLAAHAGLTLPFGDPTFDPFAQPGFHRRSLKFAFNCLLNARSRRAATAALACELAKSTDPVRHTARQLVEQVYRSFPELGEFFGRGIGLHLQFLDSEICAAVQRTLRRRNICALSVHDSFVVPLQYTAALKQAMDAEMDRTCLRLSRAGVAVLPIF